MFRIEYVDGRRATSPNWPSDQSNIRSIHLILMPDLSHLHDQHRFLDRLKLLVAHDELSTAINILTAVADISVADARYLVTHL